MRIFMPAQGRVNGSCAAVSPMHNRFFRSLLCHLLLILSTFVLTYGAFDNVTESTTSTTSTDAVTTTAVPWGGSICGNGRRRRSNNVEGCICVGVTNGLCTQYLDNCCEPPSQLCCGSMGCAASDPACGSTVTTTTVTLTTTTMGLCAWQQNTLLNSVLECNDGTMCDSSWNCCDTKGGKARCPPNQPNMCAEKGCGGGTDFCCVEDCETLGGPRLCMSEQRLAAGLYHSLFLGDDGTALSTGDNMYGQLGGVEGVVADVRLSPAEVGKLGTDVYAISAGEHHSLFLKKDGTVWAVGANHQGQLGDGTTSHKSVPVQILSDVRAMSAGTSHSLFWMSDGTAWGTGFNSRGQLGDGTTATRFSPVQVFTDVEAVFAGGAHSIFLRNGGVAWAAGWNQFGQLGDGTSTDQASPVAVLSNVRFVAAGSCYTVFVRNDDTAWTTGCNSVGQLGDGTTNDRSSPVQVLSDVQSVAAGTMHTLFLRTDGTVWAAGYNWYGQLGDSSRTDRYDPVPVLDNVQAIAAGSHHSLFLRGGDRVWVAGHNSHGQLGDGTKAVDERGGSPTPVGIALNLGIATTTTRTTVTRTTTVTPTAPPDTGCSPNEFTGTSVFDAAGMSKYDVLWASQLQRALGHHKWRANETWTLSFRATSSDTEDRGFAIVGGLWFLIFIVPAGASYEHIRVTDKIKYGGADATVQYIGSQNTSSTGVGSGVFISDVYLAPGFCTEQQGTLSFLWRTGDWGECSADCGNEGTQTRPVPCGDPFGRTKPEATCIGEKPVSRRVCYGQPCDRIVEGLSAGMVAALIAVPLGFAIVAVCLCMWFGKSKNKSAAIAPAPDPTTAPRMPKGATKPR